LRLEGLDHVSLLVEDLDASLAFYADVLGLEQDAARPALGYAGAWLRLPDGRQIHLLRLPSPDVREGRPLHGGRDRHLALLIDDLSALMERLRAAGVDFTLSKSGRRALFCRDPDANAVELMESGGSG
jgi:glyoxylase I family protein